MLQANDAALGPTQHRTRHVESRSRRCATRDHERIRQRYPALELVDLGLQPAGGVWRHHHEMLLELVILRHVGGQLGANGKQLALDPQDDRMPAAVLDQRPGRAQRRDRLIDSTVGLGARIRLGDPTAVEKPGLSPIPGPGDDALARDGDA